MNAKGLQMIGRCSVRFFVAVVLASLCGQFLFAQVSTGQDVVGQIGILLQEKETRTSDQQKLDSQLWYALQAYRGQALAGVSDVYATAVDTVNPDTSGFVRVDISAVVSDSLLNQIAALEGSVAFASPEDQIIHATVPLMTIETLAANPNVLHIAPARAVHNQRRRADIAGLYQPQGQPGSVHVGEGRHRRQDRRLVQLGRFSRCADRHRRSSRRHGCGTRPERQSGHERRYGHDGNHPRPGARSKVILRHGLQRYRRFRRQHQDPTQRVRL